MLLCEKMGENHKQNVADNVIRIKDVVLLLLSAVEKSVETFFFDIILLLQLGTIDYRYFCKEILHCLIRLLSGLTKSFKVIIKSRLR